MDGFDTVLSDFEDFISGYSLDLDTFHPFLSEAFLEMVKNGGKRFRPALLLSVVHACSREFVRNAFLPAFSLECMHTYSLIHDDLPCMDNASLRRNHATLHVKYDEASAVLIGDGLNTFSFYLLSKSKLSDGVKVELIRELSYNGGIHGMVLGQSLDCHFENDPLDIDGLGVIHTNKTAKLVATSLKMGAIIANLPLQHRDILYNFGLSLGMYFQVRDDIVDKTETSQEAGKTTNSDATKNSYVNLLGLDGARRKLDSVRDLLDAEVKRMSGLSCGEDMVCAMSYVLESLL